MPTWILATLFAAFMQNLRFLLQRHLKVTTLSTMGATWARFAFAMPFVALALILYASASGQVPPKPAAEFWGYITVGGIAQMLATACVVALFARRNFAVGITLKKTEVILTALIGLVVLGEGVSTPVVAAIGVGFLGVLLLSDPPKGEVALPWRDRVFNAASGYGLASGLLFGISAVCYRGATLSLPHGDAVIRAAVALLAATVVQTATLGLWLAIRERGEIARVLAAWRVAGLTGLTSMLGSMGWFTAFALQTAAYVKALGQVELVFTFLFSVFWLREKSSGKEIGGIVLIVGSLLLIILGSL
jgi:drug/metabolite transporter (DMT)-like permease